MFVWVGSDTLASNATVVIALDDDYSIGVLQSRPHELWSRGLGTQLRESESGLRYAPRVFETFPESGPGLCITYPGIERVERLVEASVDHPLRADVAARKERRVHLLEFLDRASDGDPSRTVSNFGDLGFGQPELYSLAGYLGARGFVAFAGHELAITGLGIRALDEASTDPTLRF